MPQPYGPAPTLPDGTGEGVPGNPPLIPLVQLEKSPLKVYASGSTSAPAGTLSPETLVIEVLLSCTWWTLHVATPSGSPVLTARHSGGAVLAGGTRRTGGAGCSAGPDDPLKASTEVFGGDGAVADVAALDCVLLDGLAPHGVGSEVLASTAVVGDVLSGDESVSVMDRTRIRPARSSRPRP